MVHAWSTLNSLCRRVTNNYLSRVHYTGCPPPQKKNATPVSQVFAQLIISGQR